MGTDDIRALARATARVAYAIEVSGRVGGVELLQTIEAATANPVLGFDAMCSLAARAGVDYTRLGVGLPADAEPCDLDDGGQACYRIAYVTALGDIQRSDDAIKVSEAARMLGRTPLRVRQLIDSGRLPGERRGGLWYVSRADVEAMLEERGA